MSCEGLFPPRNPRQIAGFQVWSDVAGTKEHSHEEMQSVWIGESARVGFESVLRKRRYLEIVKVPGIHRDLDGSGLGVESRNPGLLREHKVEVGK